MTRALIVGAIYKAPEQRQSKSGKAYVVATVKVKDGDAFQWWRVTSFSESAAAELMRLSEGDSISVQGLMTAGLYTKDGGETRITFSLIADHVLALRQPPKDRKAKAPEPQPQDTRSRQQRCAGTWAPGAGPSDDFPF